MLNAEQIAQLTRIKADVQVLANEASTAGLYTLSNVLNKAIYVKVGAVGRYNPHRAVPIRCPVCLASRRSGTVAKKPDNNGYSCSNCGYEGNGWTS